MLQILFTIAVAIEKLIPFLTKLLDLIIEERDKAHQQAEANALATDKQAKDARNEAAIEKAKNGGRA